MLSHHPRFSLLSSLVSLLSMGAFLGVAGCGDDDGTGGAGATGGAGGGTGGEGGAGGGVVQNCDPHATQGATSFADTTDAWGLVGVYGGRVMSGDLNGDGYPDLVVHGFKPNTREVVDSATEPRRIFVLLNEASGSGRTFVDRTYESGFAKPADGSETELKSSHLAVLADVDNDGDLDVFSGTYSDDPLVDPPSPADLDRSEIYLNDGSANFTLVASSGVEFPIARRTSSATFTDFDLDGNVDLFVGVHYTDSGSLQAPALYQGAGDGTFTDVTADQLINRERRATFGVTSCDLDDDGSAELLMTAYARGPEVLFHNTGSGFEDLGESSGLAHDDNEDYHDNQFFLCWCTVNADDPECAGVDDPAVVCPTPAGSYWSMTSETKPDRLGGNTFSTVCRDIDQDGKLDLYTVEIAHWWAGQSSDKSDLLLNKSEGPGSFVFERQDREAIGIQPEHVGVDWNEGGIVGAAADLDGDARPDLILGTSDYPDQYSWIYHQNEDGTFTEVGEEIGIHHPCAVGVTTADFDRDGDLDVVVASGTARDCAAIWMPAEGAPAETANEIHIYENGGEAASGWIAVRLVGSANDGSNAAAIGAKVTVDAGGLKQVQQLTSGYGHFGLQNDTVLFYSIGDCTSAATIEVVWPNGEHTTTTYENVEAGRLVELRQGDNQVYDVLASR